MVVFQRFLILAASVYLLAGCGDGGAEQYRTFQPAGQTGAAMAAERSSEPSGGLAEAAVQASAPVPSVPTAPAGGVAASEGAVASEGTAVSEGTAASAGTAASGGTGQSGLPGAADGPVIDNGVPGEVREIQLLVPQKRFRRERPSEAVRVSYDDIDLLKVLNMEPVPADAVEHFPEWLKSLDGKLVRIRGFMFPTFVATGLTEFALARDNGICCFVRQPKIYDIMNVQLAEGETTDYIANRPFDVEGIFRIDPDSDQPQLSRLYRIEQARVLQ